MKKELISEKQASSHHSTQRDRLRYRSWHRGCKETDLILGRFADEKLPTLDASLLESYERLLAEDDSDIWEWITGKHPVPAEYEPLLQMMKREVDS